MLLLSHYKTGNGENGGFSTECVKRGYKQDQIYLEKYLLVQNAAVIAKSSMTRAIFRC